MLNLINDMKTISYKVKLPCILLERENMRNATDVSLLNYYFFVNYLLG